jgi:4'-phosphopantetheinyl transferase
VAGLSELLADDERARAGRYRVEPARTQFVITRALLRTLLAGYLGAEPAEIAFAHGPHGKPALAGRASLHFNVSHTHGAALFAFTTRGEVGVDVEQVRPRINHLELADRFFAPAESAALRALGPAEGLQAFYNAWTRKEAFLKATGLGLSYGSERVEVTLLPGEPARLLRLAGDERAAARWSLEALAPLPGYVGALALEGTGYRLRCWHWPDR